jgi:hypothetical protein
VHGFNNSKNLPAGKIMSKLTIVGLLTTLGGLVVLGFQAISSLMGTKEVWKSLSLRDVLDSGQLGWIDQVALLGVDRGLDYLVSMPLFALLVGSGAILLLISGFIYK